MNVLIGEGGSVSAKSQVWSSYTCRTRVKDRPELRLVCIRLMSFFALDVLQVLEEER